jgi:DNA-binding NarL/FixJ family response regulator
VLLADDYPAMVKAVSRLLTVDCDVVGSVADGEALLEAAARLQPDVVVLDVNLPKVHGLEACRRVLAAHPAIKVVVFTATIDAEIRGQFLAAGASAFVTKTGGEDLLAAIKRVSGAR